MTAAAGAAEGRGRSSSLSGRATAAPPNGPRVPLRQWLGEMFDSIVRCFRPACADCGRLTDARRDAAAEALQQCIERTYNTIVSAHPSPLAIQAELVGAARAANELKRVGGGTRAVVDGLERDLRSLSAQHLTRLAKALRSPQVAEAEETAARSQ